MRRTPCCAGSGWTGGISGVASRRTRSPPTCSTKSFSNSRTGGWLGKHAVQSLALQTFGILATIELAWSGFKLAFRGADVSEWLAEIVNQILFLGFFLALLAECRHLGHRDRQQFSAGWPALRAAVGIAPSDVFAAGVNTRRKTS